MNIRLISVAGCMIVSMGCMDSQPAETEAASAPLSAEAGKTEARREHRDGAEHHKKFMGRLDPDGDGNIEVASLPERMKTRMASADADGNGLISRDEMKASFEKRKAEHFARADKNSDGALDSTEMGERRWAHVQAADSNADGKVTVDERVVMK
jgi:hypothetical protein